LIDVREASEYAEGHIPGAINIPLRTLTQNLDKVPADQPVFVYCASGLRAGDGADGAGLLGYDNVKSFPPGWKGWSEGGEEVSTEAVEAAVVTPKEVNPEMLAAVDEFLVNIPEGYFSVGTVEKMVEALDAGAQALDVRETSRVRARPRRRGAECPDPHAGAEPGQHPDRPAGDRLLCIWPPRRHQQRRPAHHGAGQCARLPAGLRRLGSRRRADRVSGTETPLNF
jgi:rhodanese-related sulfurtransferase